jgi:hypothetical protein
VTYKEGLTPEEWYGYTKQFPKRYRLLKNYIRESNWGGVKHPRWDYTWTPPPVMPRHWFSPAQMFVFLLKHQNVKDYKHVHFRTHTNGRVSVGFDVARERECEYFWSEVKAVLEILIP